MSALDNCLWPHIISALGASVLAEGVQKNHAEAMATILIADDSPFQLALLRSGLETRGFQVVGAEDGLQTSMMALRTKPDAIVLDISMPGGSGLEVIKRLRRSSKTSGIPVVIVTADSEPRTRETAISLGASGFFYKPINIDHLAGKLSELCASPKQAKKVPVSASCERVGATQSSDITPLPESIPAPLRSWRDIFQEVTEKHPLSALGGKTSRR
jgi:CheY-like chemotaxis protein